jgi:hypothetical protein
MLVLENEFVDSEGIGGRWKFAPMWLFLMLYVFGQPSAAQSGMSDLPDANPGRPTVSTPAALTPVGYLQLENGTLFADHSTEFSNRLGVSQVTKLSVLPRLELCFQSEPLAVSRSEGQHSVHEGEVFAGAQGVLFSGAGPQPTVSVSYIQRIHVSVAPELDTGTFRRSGLFLVSDDVHRFHLDVNGIIAEQAQDGVRRAQFGQTLSISHPLESSQFPGRCGISLSHSSTATPLGISWAVSYPVRKNLVVDGGFDHGLTKTSTQ